MSSAPARRSSLSILAAIGLIQALAFISMPSPARSGEEPHRGPESLERPGLPRSQGKLARDLSAGLRFVPDDDASRPIPLEPGAVVAFPSPQPPATAIPPLFQAEIGVAARISGTLVSVTEKAMVLRVPWQEGAVNVSRPGVQSLLQRPGEAAIFTDSFDALERSRWVVEGRAEVVPGQEGPESRRHLVVGPGSASATHRLVEPLGSGRLEVSFLDDGKLAKGNLWTLELQFRGPDGPALLKILLGWEEESLAVECPSGPSLAVQRLARSAGWHRLSVRFGPKQTEVAVDGKELAHGKGAPGPLLSLGLVVGPDTKRSKPPDLAGRVREIQLVQFAEPPTSVEIDPTQDEVRLVVGDQLFGRILRADPGRVVIDVSARPIELNWSEVAGLHFRREPALSRPIQGAWVRADWKSSPGDSDRVPDFAEGAVAALSASHLTLETPYCGTITLPLAVLTSLRILDPGWRQVLDPASHHLGDEVKTSPVPLDPPVPEGGVLERAFTLDRVDGTPIQLDLDVRDVVGETGSPFSQRVQKGEIRTFVALNGKRFDSLNRHISTANETPERIRIPLPVELLKPGSNILRIEQTGTASDPTAYDDLEILQMAIQRPPAGATAVKPAGTTP